MSQNTTRITLYVSECFGCDRNGKYDPLRKYILDQKIPLSHFVPKRIQLNPEWREKAYSYGIELPLLVIEQDGKDTIAINYEEWCKKLNKKERAKNGRRRASKGCN